MLNISCSEKNLLRAEDYPLDSMACCKGAVLCEKGNLLSLEVMLATDFMPTFLFIKVIACSTLKQSFQVEKGKLMETKTSLKYSNLSLILYGNIRVFFFFV